MRKALALILLSLLSLTLVAAIVATVGNHPPDWQVALDAYVEYKDTLSPGTTMVRAVERAQRPWNFSRDMSRAVFGDNVSYQTDYTYDENRRTSAKPRPFPPQEVWCVLLERDPSSASAPTKETTYAVVFVAEHHDLHNADIVVHEGAADLFSRKLGDSLSLIGCDLNLEQLPEQVER
jgi:hypothetical protein